ncbi:MAG: GNAT family N-acetyltransferase, partial [bacterium]|nr:GNAT family N-acetyltransferase [bacterium]
MRIDRVSREQLFQAHCEAFSDYAVDMSYMTEERIAMRAVKNNVDFDVSVGVFDGERMVGFTLIAVDRWQGELAAFDAGTGIVPGFRGQGLAQKMFDHAIPKLVERGVTRFLLEVLVPNEAAIRAYRKVGFEITRQVGCFVLEPGWVPAAAKLDDSLPIRPVDRDTIAPFRDHVDWQPSWENGFPAIRRIPDELVMFGAFAGITCVGVIVYSPQFNWIMSLVVERPYRRRGIASALVRQLVEHLPDGVSKVKMINVDRSDEGMLRLLDRLGF